METDYKKYCNQYNYYVDPCAENSGKFVYRTLQEALENIKDGSIHNPMRVYLLPGVYWIHNSKDSDMAEPLPGDKVPFGIKIKCNNLHIIGLGENPQDVVIAANRGQSHGAKGNYTMFQIIGDNFRLSNLTIGNYCSVDLVYEKNHNLDYPKRTNAITQAQLGFVEGDRFYADNCMFIGRLNLFPFCGAKRSLYYNCHFEMTDDALNDNAVYLECEFDFYGNRPIFKSTGTGVVFLNCIFYSRLLPNGIEHTQYFTKEGGAVTVVDCRHISDGNTPFEWTKYPEDNLKCYVYNNVSDTPKHEGAPAIGTEGTSTVYMDNREILSAYRLEKDSQIIYNIYNLLGGEDEWDVLNQKAYIKELRSSPTQLVIEGASYKLSSDLGNNKLELTAYALTFSGLPVKVDVLWEIEVQNQENSCLSIETDRTRCYLIGHNYSEKQIPVTVHARTKEGLEAQIKINVMPSILEPPKILGQPYIEWEHDRFRINCQLLLEGHSDESSIEWYRLEPSDNLEKSVNFDDYEPILVAKGRENEPLWEYFPSVDDDGCFVRAIIRPKHNRSLYGEPVVIQSQAPAERKCSLKAIIEPELSVLPLEWQTVIRPGRWLSDCFCPKDFPEKYICEYDDKNTWKYGVTGNGSVGEGLYQAVQGARLIYTPKNEEIWSSMSVCILADPAKTAGQGFGRAGQYMDIAVGMNIKVMTGWALRIERAGCVSDAVAAYLVRYENGLSTGIGERIFTSAFVTGCRIEVLLSRGCLKAFISTETEQPNDKREKGYAAEVRLCAEIQNGDEPFHGGVMILHTGTCGTGGWQNTTMLHKVKIEYKTQ